MSVKLKLLLAVLALGTLFSASYFLSSFGRTTLAHQTANQGQVLKSLLEDTDHDGLTARDEEYWRTDVNIADTDGDGFSDGEEVLSGHSPLVKGPADYLDPGKNLTQRTENLTLGGILAGDLDPKSPNYKASVKALAASMVEQYQKNGAQAQDVLTILQDSPETKFEYLKAIAPGLLHTLYPAVNDTDAFLESFKDVSLSDPSTLTDDSKRYTDFSQRARRLSATMADRAASLAQIPVPKSFVPQHNSAVRYLRLLQGYYMATANLKNDPLQGTVALSSLIRLQYEALPQFLYDFATAMAEKSK